MSYNPEADPFLQVSRPVAARILGDQSEYRINRLIADGAIKVTRDGNRVRVSLKELDRVKGSEVTRFDILGAIVSHGFERTRKARK